MSLSPCLSSVFLDVVLVAEYTEVMDISVVITSYKGLHILQQCLKPTYEKLKSNGVSDIVLIDDASDDGTVEYIKEHFPDILLVENNSNLGFGKSSNKAVQSTKNDIVLLLNNDMVIDDLNLEMIFPYFKQDDIFSVTPMICRSKQKGKNVESITLGYFKGGWLSTENLNCDEINYVPKEKQPVLWGCGGGMFIDKRKFLLLQGFHPLFHPFYCEDLDLSYRAWQQGWKSIYSAHCVFFHQHQATIGTYFTKNYVNNIARRNRYLFMWSSLYDRQMILSHVVTVLIKFLTFQIKDIRAVIMALFKFPDVIRKRKSNVPNLKDRDILNFFKELMCSFFESRNK